MKSIHFLLLSTAAGLLLNSSLSRAHECGPSSVEVKVNQCITWEITADVAESEPTSYSLTTPPGAGVSVSPNAGWRFPGFPFATKNLGVYRICGNSVGTHAFTAHWVYAPNVASADCPVSVVVVNEDGTPGSNSDDHDSGESGDPVNTYSGEFYQTLSPDLVLDGPFPIQYQRYFSSGLLSSGARSGRLGAGWMDNYTSSISGDFQNIDVYHLWGKKISFQFIGGSWQQQLPADPQFQLQQIGSDFVLLDPRDRRRYVYDNGGRLIAIKDRNDNTLTLSYTGDTEIPDSVSDGLGRVLNFSYVGVQTMGQVSDGTRSVSYSYSFAGNFDNLVQFTDANGGVHSYNYQNPFTSRAGLLLSETRPEANAPLAQVYDNSFKVIEQNTADANTWSFSYAAPVTTITDPDSNIWLHMHDAVGQRTGIENPLGDVQVNNYNSDGQSSTSSSFGGLLTTKTFHAPSGYVASFTDERNQTANYHYTSNLVGGFTYWDLSSIDFPDGRTYTFTYDNSGNRLTFTDGGNNTWTTTYNSRGQALTVTSALGGVTTYTYDVAGRLATKTDQSNNTTSYSYDAFHRLQTLTRPDTNSRVFGYDNLNQLASLTDEAGKTTQYLFDNNSRLIKKTDANLLETNYQYDSNDRLTIVTDRNAAIHTQTYDALSHIATQQSNNGELLTYIYDSRGNLAQKTDIASENWLYSYDQDNRMTGMSNPLMEVTTFTYDGFDRILSSTNAAGGVTAFTWGPLQRLLNQNDGIGRDTSYQYDSSGHLSGISLPALALSTTVNNNALGLVTQIVDPNSNNWNWTYDNQGRLTTMTDPLSQNTTYTYDNRNRYQQITYPGSLGSETLSYDGMNRLLQRSFSNGDTVQYAYDNLGRVVSGSHFSASYDAEGRMLTSNGLDLGRDTVTGRLTSVRYSASRLIQYNYSANGRLSSIDDGLGGLTQFTYDSLGRISTMTRPNLITTTYQYDGDGELVNVSDGTYINIQLSRDLAGQISSAVRDQPVHYATNQTTLVQAANTNLEVQGLVYDQLGRLSNDGSLSLDWDGASRLKQRSYAGSVADYQYDAFNRVVQKTEGGTTADFVWNYGLTLPGLAIYKQAGVDLWYSVFSPDGLLLYRINAQNLERQYYHFDEMGHTLMMSDEMGQPIQAYGYDPYGQRSEFGNVSDNLFTWNGQYSVLSDVEDKLYLVGSRVYDAERMHFVSRDRINPHIHPLAFNPYVYGLSNPLYFVDSSGDQPNASANQSPGLVDVVSEGLGVLSAAGGTQSILETVAENALDNARSTTAEAGRQFANGGQARNQVRGALNQAVTNQNRAQKTLSQTKTKGMKNLGKLGTAATFLGGLVEAYKLHEQLDDHGDNWSRAVKKALKTAELRSDNAFRSYKLGNISEEKLRERLDEIKKALDEIMETEQSLYYINTAISTVDATGRFIGGLIPEGDKLYTGLRNLFAN